MKVRSFVRIIIAFALAVMSVAGIGSVAVAQPTGSITGHVLTDNGTPIEAARVAAYEWATNQFVAEDYSSAAGSYSITGLPEGSYRVRATAIGYMPQYYINQTEYSMASSVEVTPPDATTGINFGLTVGSTITGHVYTDNGTPIWVARVVALHPDTRAEVAEGYSAADGSYSITTGADNGTYVVKAVAKGFAVMYWDNVTDFAAATPVSVPALGNTPGKDFYLPESGCISGFVYRADGQPLSTATVVAYDNSTKLWVESGNSSGVMGGAYYINLDPGTYRIRAYAPGYIDQLYDNVTIISEDFKLGPEWDLSLPVTVGTAEVSNRNFGLLPVEAVATNSATLVGTTTATLNGTLTSIGAADNVTVSFEWGTTDGGPWPNPTAGQVVTATGAFSANLTGLTPGTPYYFRAKAVGYDSNYGIQVSFTTSTLADPEVITTDATLVTATTARLNADLLTKGTAATVDVSFVYSTTPGGPYPEETTGQAMTNVGSFYYDLGSLTPKTTYYFRAMAEGDGQDEGDEKSFTTLGIQPSVTTNVATLVTTTSARMNGTLTDLGTAGNVTVYFKGGTVQGGPYDAPVGSQVLSAPGTFYFDATGLTPGTTYYYVAFAQGDEAEAWGAEQSATTLTTAPTVTTGDATLVTTTSATLNGNLTALGTAGSVIVSFEWGTTAGGPYPNVTDNQTVASTGAFTANLTGLTPGTIYYYKAKAIGNGTGLGDEVSFTTSTTPPTVTTSAATSLAATSATLNGSLTALGTATSVSVSFEWGTSTSYGSETTAQSLTAAGAFTANLTGLTANTTYHFRAKAVGHGAAVYSEDMTFTTASPPDTAAPVISQVNASDVTKSGAGITWTTNEPATSRVEYGLTEEYGSSTTLDTSLVTSHSVGLTGLKAGKTYHFRVISRDAASNETVSGDYTFETSSKSGGVPVWAWVIIGLAVVAVAGAAAFLLKGRLAQG